jgi:DNA-binding LytR/AlgR family response regulator
MTTTYRAVIAEDEPWLRQELKETLVGLWPELIICAEASNGIEAAQALETHAPDILFLDIHMPGMDGLEVARLASGRSHVVFVTAYDEYAVTAFEEGAVDYVMKPFSPARIAATIARLRQKVLNVPANLDGLLRALRAAGDSGKDFLRWITVSHADELRLIATDEICYFQADNKYTRVVMPEQESLIHRPIGYLVAALDPDTFWQIHRGTLVNVNAIAGMTRDMAGRLRVRLKQRRETLVVSETYHHLFKAF